MFTIVSEFWNICREIRCFLWRKRLNQSSIPPSIFCNNCVGAMVSHDLGLQFCSPMVNLWMYPTDYIYALSHKEFFIHNLEPANQEIQSKFPYPVGMIDGRAIYFMHYKTFEEAKRKWEARCKRINWDNSYLILVERDGCSQEDLMAFDALPHHKKIALVHTSHTEIQCTRYIKGYENKDGLSTMVESTSLFGTREYDTFDWCSWLNK